MEFLLERVSKDLVAVSPDICEREQDDRFGDTNIEFCRFLLESEFMRSHDRNSFWTQLKQNGASMLRRTQDNMVPTAYGL